MTPARRAVNAAWEVGPGRASLWRRLTPAQLFVASFLLLILLGTLGLKTIPGLYTGAPLGWLDALFTATSASCVTGLVVVNTATYFTPAGQAFLLLLIQLGGLGMITLTTLIILALGRRLSLRNEAISASGAEVAPHVSPQRLVRDVVRFTLLIEAAGALLLYLLWAPRLGALAAVWPAVFHAISAFCNAGFSTFPDSLLGFQRSPGTLLIIGSLITAGGLGFLTMEELHLLRRARRERRVTRLSLHSRLALAVTAALIVGGAALFALFEWQGVLAGLPLGDRLVNAIFLGITPRTAGFNSVDYAHTSESTNFLTILLMSIGGSPGSTAGGLKTTTVALIGLLAWSRLRGREVVSIWDRSVPEETIQRAVGLFVVVFALMTAAIFVLTSSEAGAASPAARPFLGYMFEVASAFNTVGLSMNLTPDLSVVGRWVGIVQMFVGRVGPLTFAAALARSRRAPGDEFRYAYADVVVG
jgi:trk system potassium uptake protein TrkH